MVDEKRIEDIRERFNDGFYKESIQGTSDIKTLLAALEEAKEKLNLKQRLLDLANEQIEKQVIIIVKQHKKNYKQHKQLGEYPEVCAENAKLRERLKVFGEKYEKRFKKQFDLGYKDKDFLDNTDIGIEIEGCMCYQMFKISDFRRAASAVKGE